MGLNKSHYKKRTNIYISYDKTASIDPYCSLIL